MLAFFSGFPLLYSLIFFIKGTQKLNGHFGKRVASLLPFAYALVGTFYVGLQIKNLYTGALAENVKLFEQLPLLKLFAGASILFWLPLFSRKTVFSLIHSLVFFSFLLKDLFLQLSGSLSDKNILSNDMSIYTVSILLNLGAFAIILLLSFIFIRHKRI